MKCPNPNCNKEVAPDWKLCPFCGFEPKKCSNPECSPRWLPKDAKYCPECGKMLEETNIVPIPRAKVENRNVSIGDILCTDNTTVPSSAWPVAGKTAMGVVFYVDDTGKHGWAVHLQDQGEHIWTRKGKESEVYGLRKCDTEVMALADKDGYANTKVLRAEGDASMYPVAYAVDFANGWYLPALGQLKVLFNRKNEINTILNIIKGVELRKFGCYWSSTQQNKFSAWFRNILGQMTYYDKINSYRVRSVRTF